MKTSTGILNMSFSYSVYEQLKKSREKNHPQIQTKPYPELRSGSAGFSVFLQPTESTKVQTNALRVPCSTAVPR